MIKSISFLILFLSIFPLQEKPEIDKIRDLYQKSVLEENACEQLIDASEIYAEENPLLLGYKASGTMLMAKHVVNPFSKLKYFKNGKEMLAKAIAADPKNVELRMLRFLAQSNVPGFLNYNDKIEIDKEFILKTVPEMENTETKKYIISKLTESGKFSAEEIQKISANSLSKKGNSE